MLLGSRITEFFKSEQGNRCRVSDGDLVQFRCRVLDGELGTIPMQSFGW
jgi:hypothetical protein